MKYFLFIALVASSVRAACAFDNSQWANDFKQAQSAAQQGNFPQAEKLYLEAVREAEQFGKESRYVGITLTGLAGLKAYEGNYPQAESLYRQALAIEERSEAPDSMNIAALLNNLASLYSRMGKVPEAIDCLKKSLPITEKQRGSDSLEALTVRRNLDELKTHVAADDPLTGLKTDLANRQARLGANHQDVAQSLNKLADYYAVHGRPADAEPLYKRALSIDEARLGYDNPTTLQVAENLGALYLQMQRYPQSEFYLKRALNGRERTLGKEHPSVGKTLEIYAQLMRVEHRDAQAKELEAKANAINSKAY
jgi:tetratricopeptide (TPR) repeat protein